MFNIRFKNLFDLSTINLAGDYTFVQIIANVLVALVCGVIIYWVYKKTFTGVLYSKNYGITTIIVTVITSLIVMAIHGNLALSLGMIGALSIVRFRTPVKDPKDLAYLFWGITTGVICGISAYKLALVSVLFVGLCLYVLSKNIGFTTPYLLVLKMREFDREKIAALLKQCCARFKERSVTMTDKKSEVVYEVILKKDQGSEFLKQIKDVRGVDHAVMVSYEGDLDEPR